MPDYLRRCITLPAELSPNVRYARLQIARGEVPTDELIVPGVISWGEYQERRRTLPKSRQCVVLDAKWYKGAEELLVSEEWVEAAAKFALRRPPLAHPRYMGIDPAEGGDDTAWVVGDPHGVVHIDSLKTPDTNVTFGKTLRLMDQWGVSAENVLFDRACGKVHADRLRAMGRNVRTVDFGSIRAEPKRGIRLFGEKFNVNEERGEVADRRSEMYWEIRKLLEVPVESSDDPRVAEALVGVKLPPRREYALPMPMCEELVRQLSAVPLQTDSRGRFKLIAKRNPNDSDDPNTFAYRIGRSPDIADAFALMVHGMFHRVRPMLAGAG